MIVRLHQIINPLHPHVDALQVINGGLSTCTHMEHHKTYGNRVCTLCTLWSAICWSTNVEFDTELQGIVSHGIAPQ